MESTDNSRSPSPVANGQASQQDQLLAAGTKRTAETQTFAGYTIAQLQELTEYLQDTDLSAGHTPPATTPLTQRSGPKSPYHRDDYQSDSTTDDTDDEETNPPSPANPRARFATQHVYGNVHTFQQSEENRLDMRQQTGEVLAAARDKVDSKIIGMAIADPRAEQQANEIEQRVQQRRSATIDDIEARNALRQKAAGDSSFLRHKENHTRIQGVHTLRSETSDGHQIVERHGEVHEGDRKVGTAYGMMVQDTRQHSHPQPLGPSQSGGTTLGFLVSASSSSQKPQVGPLWDDPSRGERELSLSERYQQACEKFDQATDRRTKEQFRRQKTRLLKQIRDQQQ